MLKPRFVLLLLTMLTLSSTDLLPTSKVLNKILKSAKYWYSLADGETVFMKKGGFEQAIRDFIRVADPKTVNKLDVGYGLKGKIGDKTIYLLEAKGLVSMPSVSIYSYTVGLPKTIIIKYKNDWRSP